MALLTGGAFALAATFQPAPAQADTKSKLYKGGAAALGALGAYWILEGKTIEGAAAAAGGYYAYKKGRDIEKEDRYDDYWDRDRYDDRYDYRDRDRYDYRDRDRYRYDYRRDNDRYDYDYRRRDYDRNRDRDRIGDIFRNGYRR